MQNNKVVLIVIDALRFDTACTHMGFLHHLVERQVAAAIRFAQRCLLYQDHCMRRF